MNPLVWLELARAARKLLDAGVRLVGAVRPSSSAPVELDQGAERYIAGRNDERWAQLERERAARAGEVLEAAARGEDLAAEQPTPEPSVTCAACSHAHTWPLSSRQAFSRMARREGQSHYTVFCPRCAHPTVFAVVDD